MVLLFSGCGAALKKKPKGGRFIKRPLTTSHHRDFQPLKVNSVLVYPLSGSSSYTLKLGQQDELSSLLRTTFDVESSLELLTAPDDINYSESDIQLQQRAVELATSRGAQGVLFGSVTAFQELDGTKFGAKTPARVGFKLWLYSVAEGEVVWTATYKKAQEPIASNILQAKEAFKTGLAYKSSKQLIKAGFAEAARSLEGLRKGTFESRTDALKTPSVENSGS